MKFVGLLRVAVLVLFVGLSTTLVTSEWLVADESESAAAAQSAAQSLDAGLPTSDIQGGSSIFNSGSVLAIVLVIIALVAVARRDSGKDSS